MNGTLVIVLESSILETHAMLAVVVSGLLWLMGRWMLVIVVIDPCVASLDPTAHLPSI
jgi:hypothetical protein